MLNENSFAIFEPSESLTSDGINVFIWHHYIDRELLDFLLSKKETKVVSGENNHLAFANQVRGLIASRSTTEQILNPTTGGSDEEKKEDCDNKLLLLNKDYKFWLTDSAYWDLLRINNDYPQTFYSFIAPLLLSPLEFYSVLNLADASLSKFNRRNFLKSVFWGTASLTIPTLAITSLFGGEKQEDLRINAQKIINNPDYKTVTEAVIRMRNYVMSINTRHMLYLYQDRFIGENITMYAANLHIKVKDIMKEDISNLNNYIKDCAIKMFIETLPKMINKGLPDEQIIQTMLGYAKLFSEPDQFGKQIEMFNLHNNSDVINSAAAMLILEAINFCHNKNSDKRIKFIVEQLMIRFKSYLSDCKREVYLALKESISDFNGSESGYVQGEINMDNFTNLYKLSSGKNEIHMIGVYQGRVLEIKNLNGDENLFSEILPGFYVSVV